MSGQQYNFRHYTNLDGIPQRQVLGVHQASNRGDIWIATFGGASRYDGSRFHQYTTRDGLSSNYVSGFISDRRGRPLASTGSGICRYFHRQDVFRCSGDEPVANSFVKSILLDTAATWLGTAEGVVRIGPQGQASPLESVPSIEVEALASDDDGGLWVGTVEGLYRTGPSDKGAEGVLLRGQRVNFIHRHDELGTLVGANTGLYRLHEGGIERVKALPPSHRETAYRAAAESETSLWLATAKGALCYSKGRYRIITERNGLLDNALHDVMVDREGNVWLGTQEGASKLIPGPFFAYTELHGLPNPFVRTLAVDAQNRLWVGTRDGIVVRSADGDRWALALGAADGLKNPAVYSLAAGGGAIWIGTREGLYRWTEMGGLQRLDRDGELPDTYIPALLYDSRDRLWVATGAGVRVYRDGDFHRPPIGALAEGFMLRMLEDRQGRIWFAQRKGGLGLLRTDGQTEVLDGDRGLSSQTLWDLALDTHGNVWVGSNGDGAFRITPELEIRQFRKRDGLADNFVWNLTVDQRARPWLYTNRGLTRLDGDTSRTFGASDGLVDIEGSATAAVTHPNGELWFGTGSGLMHYRPEHEQPNRYPPPVRIVSATLDGNPLSSAPYELPHSAGALRVEYTALTFRQEAAVRFRHRLLGGDDEWSPPRDSRSVTLAGLAPGDYELQIVAINREGIRSQQPATLRFHKAAPLWQHPAVVAASAATVVLLIWTAVRLSVRRIEAQRRQLELLVGERTQELQAKNRELQRLAISDELTGLCNRRYFMQRLNDEWHIIQRAPAGTALSLLIIDLDYFKSVNDRFGHHIGDRVLAETANRLRKGLRAADLLARLGGEEFAAILPFTAPNGADAVARRMLANLRDAPLAEVAGAPVWVDASVGAATLIMDDPECIASAQELMRQTDTALYAAKRAGRGRVRSAATADPNTIRG